MNDEVAAIIASLSITDQCIDDLFEPMDVDDPDEMLIIPPEEIAPYVPEVEEPESPTVKKSTISQVLSPTTLGARYALNRPLLTLAPHLSRRLLVVEINTSEGTLVKSSFSGTKEADPIPNQGVVSKNTFCDENVDMEVNRGFLSQVSGMRYDPPSHFSQQLQVHHHHYYPPQESSVSLRTTPMAPAHYNSPLQPEVEDWRLPEPWASDAHPTAPSAYVLSLYLQLCLNAAAGVGLLLIVAKLVLSLKNDVNAKVEAQVAASAVAIEKCRQIYERDCVASMIVPATEQYCAELDRCRQRDPRAASQFSSVLAETVGVIINALIQPLGFKVFLVAFGVFACNFIFGYVRAKTYYGMKYKGGELTKTS